MPFVVYRLYEVAPVAQLDRVPGYEPGGREFESLRARQLNIRNQLLTLRQYACSFCERLMRLF